MINDWWSGKDLEGSDSDLIEVLCRYFFRGIMEIHKTPVTIAGVAPEYRTKHLPNTSLECWRYTN
jgi:hypothetical protein